LALGFTIGQSTASKPSKWRL